MKLKTFIHKLNYAVDRMYGADIVYSCTLHTLVWNHIQTEHDEGDKCLSIVDYRFKTNGDSH